MAPLGGAEVDRDDAGPVDAAEIAVNERVAPLRLVVRTDRQPEMPLGVLVPRM
jgi:hypothetical protein